MSEAAKLTTCWLPVAKGTSNEMDAWSSI